jgi:hypothetical protein
MVGLAEEAVVVILDLPLDPDVGDVLHLPHPGVTVVLTLDPAR